MKSLPILLVLLLGLAGWAVAAGDSDSIFAEKPGVLEFSGRMIVRPLQDEALSAQGLAPFQISQQHLRAAARLDAIRIRHEADVDEHIVLVPTGHDENSFAAQLMSTGDYEYVVPDWTCYPIATHPNDPKYNQQWHHDNMESANAWDIFTGTSSHIAAFVDTGVKKTHADLSGHLVSGYNSADRIPESQGGNVNDVNGHGTAVAGCIGAIGNNGTGVAGVCWTVSLMPIRATNSSSGGAYLSDLTHGARWAAQNGAKTVSVSYSGVSNSTVQSAGSNVKANGGLLIWAAGNDGTTLNSFDHADVIVVGATTQSDNKASFSNYGLAIDVMAPGVDIMTTNISGGYSAVSGTSFSAPLTNGLCALIWGYGPASLPDDVENFLFDGCDSMGSSSNYGHGRINVYESILLVGGGGAPPMPDAKVNGADGPLTLFQGQQINFTVSLDPGGHAGTAFDWWVFAEHNPPSITAWYWKYPGSWQSSFTPIRAYNGGLISINDYLVGSSSNLQSGDWEFTFAVDDLNNAYEGTYEDVVEVTIL